MTVIAILLIVVIALPVIAITFFLYLPSASLNRIEQNLEKSRDPANPTPSSKSDIEEKS